MLKNRALSFLVYTLDSKVIIGAQGLKPFSLVSFLFQMKNFDQCVPAALLKEKEKTKLMITCFFAFSAKPSPSKQALLRKMSLSQFASKGRKHESYSFLHFS